MFVPQTTVDTNQTEFERNEQTTKSDNCHGNSSVPLDQLKKIVSLGEKAMMIAHEMRNPLCVILNVLNHCKELELNDFDKIRLTLALDEAVRLKQMVDELLKYTRHSNNSALQLNQIRLKDLLDEVMNLVVELPLAAGRQIVFTSNLSDVIIEGDRDKLKQVFLNLLINSFDAICVGEMVFVCHRLEANSSRILIQIHNGGQLIPTYKLPLLGHQRLTTKTSGHGLGLLIVKEIIEAHAGEFEIESSESHGTTAYVRLPIQAELTK